MVQIEVQPARISPGRAYFEAVIRHNAKEQQLSVSKAAAVDVKGKGRAADQNNVDGSNDAAIEGHAITREYIHGLLYSKCKPPPILETLRKLQALKTGAPYEARQSLDEDDVRIDDDTQHVRPARKRRKRPKVTTRAYVNSEGPSCFPAAAASVTPSNYAQDIPATHQETDELAWSGATLVWSKGSVIYRKYTYQEEQEQGYHIRQALFAYFEVSCYEPDNEQTSAPASRPHLFTSRNAETGPFQPDPAPPWSDNASAAAASRKRSDLRLTSKLVRVLCVLFRQSLYLYYPSGESQKLHLPNAVKQAWALRRGILFENVTAELSDILGAAYSPDPLIQSGPLVLLDPFEGFLPVEKQRQSPSRENFNDTDMLDPQESNVATLWPLDSSEQVVFCSDCRDRSQAIIVTLNTSDRRISVWSYEVRKEELADEIARLEAELLAKFQAAGDNAAAAVTASTDDTPRAVNHVAPAALVIGKRRRDAETSMQMPQPTPAVSGTEGTEMARRTSVAPRATSELPRQGQSLANAAAYHRRRSLSQAVNVVGDPETSVADFLQNMGTNPASMADIHAVATQNGRRVSRNLQDRRTSAAVAAAQAMDRRASTTRNELSVTLDRLILDAQSGQAAHRHRPSSTAAAVAALPQQHVPASQTSLASQGSQSSQRPPEAQIIARQASDDAGPHRETAQSDADVRFVVTRLHSIKIGQSETASTADTSAIIFDVRGSTSILAIMQRHQQKLSLFTLAQTPSGPSCSALKQLNAVQTRPVLFSRTSTNDLLVRSVSNACTILTAHAHAIAVDRAQPDNKDTSRSVIPDSVASRDLDNVALPRLHTGCFIRRILQVISACVFLKTYTTVLRSVTTATSESPAVIAASVLCGFFPDISPVTALDSSDGDALLVRMHASILADSPHSPIPSRDMEAALFGLQFLSQEWMLLRACQAYIRPLSYIISAFAFHLRYQDYVHQAAKQGAPFSVCRSEEVAGISTARSQPTAHARSIPAPYDVLEDIANFASSAWSSTLPAPWHSIVPTGTDELANESQPPFTTLAQMREVAILAMSNPKSPEPLLKRCAELQWTQADLQALSPAVSVMIQETLLMHKTRVDGLWPLSAIGLLGRTDLLMQQKSGSPHVAKKDKRVRISSPISIDDLTDVSTNVKPLSQRDPHGQRKDKDRATRFSGDLRLDDVSRMLSYSTPLTVAGPTGPSITETTLPAAQQQLVLALAYRTLSLPIGSALFLYRVATRPRSHATSIPKVELQAKLLPHQTLVTPTNEAVPVDHKTWPFFHSGVAVGLHINWPKDEFDASEYAFNKPSELNARHAGFLLGLGLNGQLRTLDTYQAFRYMDPKHDMTSIGLLVGLGATYMLSRDAKVTSALTVHVSALHPPSAAQLNVTLLVQSAGALALGLVHLGTRPYKFSDNMLREIKRTRVVSTEHPDGCKEAYNLSLAFSYGLMTLGQGGDETGPHAAETLAIFRQVLAASQTPQLPGARICLEGAIDVATTAPAAAVALALSFMRSERQDIADMLDIPQSVDRLDFVRNDLILTRTICRALIMWKAVEATSAWIDSCVPPFVRLAMGAKHRNPAMLPSEQELAYWNIVAGCCMAIGLKYAGSANGEAHALLLSSLDKVTKRANGVPYAGTLRCKLAKHSLNTCVSTICLALSSVMAGTGELNVLRRLRVLHGFTSTRQDSYGFHMATHMSLGLLFLGKGRYTLGTSMSATALLFCAFYPAFPAHPSDNRFHLQAYRHLWVLAAEPRCLIARDIDTGKSVYVPLRVRTKAERQSSEEEARSAQLVAPTLVPELSSLLSVQTDSPRYWPVKLELARHPEQISSFIHQQSVFVKRKAGHLDYASDPRGLRSVFTWPQAEAVGSITLDSAGLDSMAGLSELSALIGAYASTFGPARATLRYLGPTGSARLTDSSAATSRFLLASYLTSLVQDKAEIPSLHRCLLACSQQLSDPDVGAVRLAELQTLIEQADTQDRLGLRKRTSLLSHDLHRNLSTQVEERLRALYKNDDLATTFRDYITAKSVTADKAGSAMLRSILADPRLPSFDQLASLVQAMTRDKRLFRSDESRSGIQLALRAMMPQARLELVDLLIRVVSA